MAQKIDKIILASRNPDKIREFRRMLANFNIELLTPDDFPDLEEVVEDKPDLQGNALKKARYTSHNTGIPALSDDTGLEVYALDMRPGVYSARYAGEDVTYQENVIKLLGEMKNLKEDNHRKARFRTVLAFVNGSGEYLFEGICEGRIIPEQRGNSGFGYDPVFYYPPLRKTLAEMSPAEKNSISHRGEATRKFFEWLSEK